MTWTARRADFGRAVEGTILLTVQPPSCRTWFGNAISAGRSTGSRNVRRCAPCRAHGAAVHRSRRAATAVVSGQTYEEYIQQHIFDPLPPVSGGLSWSRFAVARLRRGRQHGVTMNDEPDITLWLHDIRNLFVEPDFDPFDEHAIE
jgi:hypothetical protein